MTEPIATHRCAGPSCPGLPYRASEIAHPPSCSEKVPRPLTPDRIDLIRAGLNEGSVDPDDVADMLAELARLTTERDEMRAARHHVNITCRCGRTLRVTSSVDGCQAVKEMPEGSATGLEGPFTDEPTDPDDAPDPEEKDDTHRPQIARAFRTVLTGDGS